MLLNSHTDMAAHIEQIAEDAFQMSNRAYSQLIALLEDNSTESHIQDLKVKWVIFCLSASLCIKNFFWLLTLNNPHIWTSLSISVCLFFLSERLEEMQQLKENLTLEVNETRVTHLSLQKHNSEIAVLLQNINTSISELRRTDVNFTFTPEDANITSISRTLDETNVTTTQDPKLIQVGSSGQNGCFGFIITVHFC